MTKRRKWYLVIMIIISIVVGLHLVISPETVKLWIIQGIGVVWILEGISSFLELWKDLIIKKGESGQEK